MGSIFREDIIGAVTEAGGTIFLAPSRITFGGRQLENTASISVATSPVTPNTRHQVYAVNNAGSIDLVISSNENSVGPNGYTRWKLVASYQAGDGGNFGAFFNISGKPILDVSGLTTPGLPYSGLIVDQNGTNVQSGSPSYNNRYYTIEGRFLVMAGQYYHTTTPGIAGVGRYQIRGPQNFTFTNNSKNNMFASNSSINQNGQCSGDIGGGNFMTGHGGPPQNNNSFNAVLVTNNASGYFGQGAGQTYTMSSNFLGISWQNMRYECVGLSDTPIEDR